MNILGSDQSALEMKGVMIHTHPHWEIILLLSGEDHLTNIGGDRVRVGVGDIMVIPPGVPHNGEPDIPENDVLFSDIYVAVDELGYDRPFVAHDWDGCVAPLMRMVRKVVSERESGWQQIAASLTESIKLFIDKNREQVWRYDFVAEFKNYLVANLSDPKLDIPERIRLLGYNPDYFRRCFVSELGVTPLSYLTDLRIGKAKELLRNTVLPVSEIAARCGFSDNFWFSKRFRRLTGMTAREYRDGEKNREGEHVEQTPTPDPRS